MTRYVVNLCSEAPAPNGSRTQIELAIRELRMYARKEAGNELPGSRTVCACVSNFKVPSNLGIDRSLCSIQGVVSS